MCGLALSAGGGTQGTLVGLFDRLATFVERLKFEAPKDDGLLSGQSLIPLMVDVKIT